MRELLANLLIYGAACAGVVAVLGLAVMAASRVWSWWQAGRRPPGVSVIVSIGR